MVIKTVKDISNLTNIPEKYYKKLEDEFKYIICDGIEDMLLVKDSTVEFDIGIGSLIIGIDNDEVKYKFIPATDLEKDIVSTIKGNRNKLTLKLEKALINKITSAYKDML